LQWVIVLINCAALFWRRDERAREVKNVQACLTKAVRCADVAGANGVAALLHGLYLVLSAISYWLVRGVGLDQTWVHAVIDVISEKHQEIVATGTTVEKVVTRPVKMIYVNSGRFMHENGLVQPDEQEDAEEAEHEPEDSDAKEQAETETEAD
jgi:hypothetical protein